MPYPIESPFSRAHDAHSSCRFSALSAGLLERRDQGGRRRKKPIT